VLFADTTKRFSRGHVVDLQVLQQSEPAAAVFLVYQPSGGCGHKARAWPFPGYGLRAGAGRFASLGFSPRDQSIQRRLERARYVPQFVVFENNAG